MLVHLYKYKFNAFTCLLAFALNACTSTEQLDPLSEQEQADKKQAIETVIEEWQESKPSIKRLVAMEGDLNTLIDELSMISSITDQVDEPVLNKEAPLAIKDELIPASNSVAMTDKAKTDKQIRESDTNKADFAQNKQQMPKTELIATADLSNSNEYMPIKEAKVTSFDEKTEMNELKTAQIGNNEKNNQTFSQAIHLATFTTLQQSKQAWFRLNGRFSHHFKGKKPMINNLNKDGIKLYRLQVGPYSSANAELLCGRLNAQNQHCIVVENEGSYLSGT